MSTPPRFPPPGSESGTHHNAIATVSLKKLDQIRVPTMTPRPNQIRVRVEWTASTPLDLHQNDGGLLVEHPQVLGDGTAGTIVEVGEDVRKNDRGWNLKGPVKGRKDGGLKVGDKVFGFTWRHGTEKAHQEYCTADEYLFAKLPEGFTLQEAVTLPNNFVTAFHAATVDLGLQLPDYPKPEGWVPNDADSTILVWGGASSVGQYAIQILNYYGYKNIATTASPRHHEKLRGFGAKWTFDYNDPHIIKHLKHHLMKEHERGLPFILDCIGSLNGSVIPLSKIARTGARVAVLLPIVVKDASDTDLPAYDMDVERYFPTDVDARGVRTHYYLENEFFKYHLQPDIMPAMLRDGVVKPNDRKIVEGATMLERAEKAMILLRRKEVSGERLVWKVSDANEWDMAAQRLAKPDWRLWGKDVRKYPYGDEQRHDTPQM